MVRDHPELLVFSSTNKTIIGGGLCYKNEGMTILFRKENTDNDG